MHLTVKKATRPACQNSLAQQARLVNAERPHEALSMKM